MKKIVFRRYNYNHADANWICEQWRNQWQPRCCYPLIEKDAHKKHSQLQLHYLFRCIAFKTGCILVCFCESFQISIVNFHEKFREVQGKALSFLLFYFSVHRVFGYPAGECRRSLMKHGSILQLLRCTLFLPYFLQCCLITKGCQLLSPLPVTHLPQRMGGWIIDTLVGRFKMWEAPCWWHFLYSWLEFPTGGSCDIPECIWRIPACEQSITMVLQELCQLPGNEESGGGAWTAEQVAAATGCPPSVLWFWHWSLFSPPSPLPDWEISKAANLVFQELICWGFFSKVVCWIHLELY